MSELLELKVDRPKLTQVSTWYIIRVNLKKNPKKNLNKLQKQVYRMHRFPFRHGKAYMHSPTSMMIIHHMLKTLEEAHMERTNTLFVKCHLQTTFH